MTKPLRLGLVSEGPLKPRALFRSPVVQAGLGPVRARSLRVASRLVNTLGAGGASQDWVDFMACEVILISAPSAGLTRIVRSLLDLRLEWEGRTVAFYQSTRDSGVLEPLERRGAATGSITCIEGMDPLRYVLEGAPGAVKSFRRLLVGSRSAAITIERGKQFLVTAGETFALELVVPLIHAAAGCLRLAGIDRKASVELVNEMVRVSLRRYEKAGPRAWRGPLAEADAEVLEAQCEALRRSNPKAAALFGAAVESALDYLNPPGKRPRLALRSAAGSSKS